MCTSNLGGDRTTWFLNWVDTGTAIFFGPLEGALERLPLFRFWIRNCLLSYKIIIDIVHVLPHMVAASFLAVVSPVVNVLPMYSVARA